MFIKLKMFEIFSEEHLSLMKKFIAFLTEQFRKRSPMPLTYQRNYYDYDYYYVLFIYGNK